MKRQQLAEAIEALIAQYGSQNELHLSSDTSLEAIRRMRRGFAARQHVVEKFARNLSLDVNRWLVMSGYPASSDVVIETETGTALIEAKTPRAPNGTELPTGDQVALATFFAEWLKRDVIAREREFRPLCYFVEAVRRLLVAMGEKTPPLDASDLPTEDATREEVEALVNRIGQEIQRRRDELRGKGGEVEDGLAA